MNKGKVRPDKLSLMQFKSSTDSPDKILFQQVILDAANNYLYFGLADKNGTNVREFWFSYEYFYRIRASDPTTWANIDRTIKKSKSNTIELTDSQIKSMCFDTQFNIANLGISQDSFLSKLKATRTQIVTAHWENIKTYLKTKQNPSKTQQNYDILTLTDENEHLIKRILISPESPEELIRLVRTRAAEDKNPVKGEHGHSKESSCNIGCNLN